MAKEKMMNESTFAKIVKAINVEGEIIRSKQDEKQAVMNEFDREQRRYNAGKISRSTLTALAKKTNKTLIRLDKEIRRSITKVASMTARAKKFASRQVPKVVRAKLAGVVSAGKKKKKHRRKAKPKAKPKAAPRKPEKKAAPKKAKKPVKKKK